MFFSSILGNFLPDTTYPVQDASPGCKVQDVMKPIVLMSVVVKDEMVWAVRILNSTFDVNSFPMVNNIPLSI